MRDYVTNGSIPIDRRGKCGMKTGDQNIYRQFQASSVPGSATVDAPAEDFSTSLTYEILFRHALTR